MSLQLSKSLAKEFESSVFSDYGGARVHGDTGDQKLQRCWPAAEYISFSIYSKITNWIKYFHLYFHFLKI